MVSLASYYLCVYTILDPDSPLQLQAANVISWIAAVTFAYFTNRRYVFESKNQNRLGGRRRRSTGPEWLTLLMDMGCMFLLVTPWQGSMTRSPSCWCR